LNFFSIALGEDEKQYKGSNMENNNNRPRSKIKKAYDSLTRKSVRKAESEIIFESEEDSSSKLKRVLSENSLTYNLENAASRVSITLIIQKN
jgi:hypothetical protein